jgi:hypothetical protein
MRETYKFYAAVGPSGNTPSIGQNIFTDLILRMGEQFVDYKSLKLSDVDLACISTNAAGLKKFGRTTTNPER